jgi:hypothetical protein
MKIGSWQELLEHATQWQLLHTAQSVFLVLQLNTSFTWPTSSYQDTTLTNQHNLCIYTSAVQHTFFHRYHRYNYVAFHLASVYAHVWSWHALLQSPCYSTDTYVTAGCSFGKCTGKWRGVCTVCTNDMYSMYIYIEACVYSKDSLQVILYVCSIGWTKNAWSDLRDMNLCHDAMKNYY